MITVQSLTFSYKKGQNILDNLSFHVPKGSLYGFLGANGSGKTTTIRLLLGLCRPDSGQVQINDTRMDAPTASIYSKIGSMIEQPSLYGHLTGEENLRLQALYHGTGFHHIEKTLSQVGLKQVGNKRVSAYSLGMKQRLGLALSLLHNPELIVLDEPLNGLDPRGMAEIRELMVQLVKQEGKTLFMSSHLLAEVESTCDAICVIDKGKMLFSGSIEELRSQLVGRTAWKIGCDTPEAAWTVLNDSFATAVEICQVEDGLLVYTTDKEVIPAINRRLVQTGINVCELTPVERKLEELYIKLTNG